jgi:hypothetical protein
LLSIFACAGRGPGRSFSAIGNERVEKTNSAWKRLWRKRAGTSIPINHRLVKEITMPAKKKTATAKKAFSPAKKKAKAAKTKACECGCGGATYPETSGFYAVSGHHGGK